MIWFSWFEFGLAVDYAFDLSQDLRVFGAFMAGIGLILNLLQKFCLSLEVSSMNYL